MSHKLAAVLLLFVLLSVGSAHPIAAQDGSSPDRSWWMNGLSFTLSVMAISSAAIGVVELAVSPKIFWMAQVLAAAFLVTGFVLVDVGSIFFWGGVLAALGMVTLIAALLLVKAVAKKVVR